MGSGFLAARCPGITNFDSIVIAGARCPGIANFDSTVIAIIAIDAFASSNFADYSTSSTLLS